MQGIGRNGHLANGGAYAAFAIVHVLLHWIYCRHPVYEFNNPSSWALIALTGVLGALYLGLAVTLG